MPFSSFWSWRSGPSYISSYIAFIHKIYPPLKSLPKSLFLLFFCSCFVDSLLPLQLADIQWGCHVGPHQSGWFLPVSAQASGTLACACESYPLLLLPLVSYSSPVFLRQLQTLLHRVLYFSTSILFLLGLPSGDGWRASPLRVTREVQQWNSLFPVNFKVLMDQLLQTLTKECGDSFNNLTIRGLAFTDDLVFLADSTADASTWSSSQQPFLQVRNST